MSPRSAAQTRCALCGAKEVSEPRGEEKYCRDCWDKKIAVEEIVAATGLEKVMFELPGPWIEGVTGSDVHRLRRELIDRYGTEVNIGNVAPDDLMSLEACRRGLGVNAGS